MSKPGWSVVIPTNRPDRFTDFLAAWSDLFDRYGVNLIVVQDLPEHDPEIKEAFERSDLEGELHHWGSIDAAHIPRQTDMVRSWGIHRAWKTGSTYTLTLDDDTVPDSDVFDEYERVFEQGAPLSPYLDVGALTSFDGQLRGFPMRDRDRKPVAVQYGGWNGVLDYDAATQLAGIDEDEIFAPLVVPVPLGTPVTGCIMNAAWRTEYAPILWQLPLLDGRFNRFGDIWAGLFAKRTLDELGAVMVVNGRAAVRHERASDPLVNLEREAPGIAPNEELWGYLRMLWPQLPRGEGLLPVYRNVTDTACRFFHRSDPEYARWFREARDEWLGLFA